MQQLCRIEHWLDTLIKTKKLKCKSVESLTPLKGDASSRSYFRLVLSPAISGSETDILNFIVVVSPTDKIDNSVFTHLAEHWQSFDVKTPLIYFSDTDLGFMLIEDFGSVHLFDQLTVKIDLLLYQKAITELLKIQSIPATALPVFDHAFLLREMNLFKQWMVEYQLSLEAPSLVDDAFQILIDSALSQPAVTMHRDYHSRNLLICDDEALGVIDFQDAVKGPISYDLVSLLKDCYFTLPQPTQDQSIDFYLQQLAIAHPHLAINNKAQFMRWFDLMGMQRHLKVLGLFIRLGVEEGKRGYLKDLPRVFSYVLKVAQKYPDLNPFHQWLVKDVEPQLIQQTWYKE